MSKSIVARYWRAIKRRRAFLKRAIYRKMRASKVPSNIADFDALVCSPGGVATTSIMEFIGGYIRTNDPADGDGLKHPIKPALGAQKILYIYGDPEDIYRSIQRRGWLGNQSSKLGTIVGSLATGALQKMAFMIAIRKQIRLFEQEEAQNVSGNVYIVKYDKLWERIEEIANFLGIEDQNFISDFPKRRPRKSASGP